MPILVSQIVEDLKADLDAEGSDYYTFDQDFKPAINKAIDWLVYLIDQSVGADKFAEEAGSELIKSAVFQPSNYSRIQIDEDAVDKVWTILNVVVNVNVHPNSPKTPHANDYVSTYRDDLSYIPGKGDAAKRLSVEEWRISSSNPFEAGNDYFAACEDLRDYAYMNAIDHTGGYDAGGKEIEIRPTAKNKFTAITYMKTPEKIDDAGDTIEFPSKVRQILYSKALNFVSYKQGDNTNIYSVSAADIQNLANSIT